MLEVSHLAVDHGQLRALWDVSFKVAKGERVALLGANGAGKSTTLGALMGLFRPAGGTIPYCGRDVGGRDTADNVDDGIAARTRRPAAVSGDDCPRKSRVRAPMFAASAAPWPTRSIAAMNCSPC